MTRPDDMRIGDAERDTVTAALHDHFAAGRLDRQELDERLGSALAAKTRGDLKAIVRDLPEPNGLPRPAPVRAPFLVTGRPHGGPPRRAGAHGRPDRHAPGHPYRHGGPFPAFPLLIGVFMVVAFTAGPAAATLAVLQLALLVWTVRAVLLAVAARRARPR